MHIRIKKRCTEEDFRFNFNTHIVPLRCETSFLHVPKMLNAQNLFLHFLPARGCIEVHDYIYDPHNTCTTYLNVSF